MGKTLHALCLAFVLSLWSAVEARAWIEPLDPSPLSKAGGPPGHLRVTAPLVSPDSAYRVLAQRARGGDTRLQNGAEITVEIQELARSLRHDPKLIYEFVKNTIEFEPIFGSNKGATATLLDLKGNDFAQSSLMIALLRASGYTPTYIRGTIRLTATQITNWLGAGNDPDVVGAVLASAGIPAQVFVNGSGALLFVDLVHVWVKVTIGATAFVFDPSFKPFIYGAGIDLKAALGYDQSTFLAHASEGATVDANYVQNVNRANMRADLATMAGNLVTYIKDNHPGAKLADVLADREIQLSRNETFKTSLPYERTRDEEFTDIPSAYDVLIRIQHLGIDLTLAASGVYGKRLTLFYNAANQPEIRVDGVVLATGSAVPPGSFNAITLTADHPYAALGGTYADQTHTTFIEAGGQYVIMNGFAHTARGLLDQHRKAIQQLIEDGEAGDSEPVRGEMLTAFSLNWLAQVSESISRLDKIARTITIPHHTLGFAGQLESPYVDIPMALVSVISTEENAAKSNAAFFTLAGISSGFEWGVFEQTQDHSAVCTVKLLDISNAKSDKIFDASLANYFGSVKPQLINYSSGELATVEAYINAGFRLMLPQDGNLNELQWTGLGFMAVSPAEDSIAHIIAGALSGGYGSEPWFADPFFLLLLGNLPYLPGGFALSFDPVDLVTGSYLYDHVDLSIGSVDFPIGLAFSRSYSSAARGTDGPLGRGWSHNFAISAGLDTDGFQGLGEDSPIDAAAAIAELYAAHDLLVGPKNALRLVTATMAHRWYIEQLIDNVVTIRDGSSARQFVKLPDGSYNPPPGKADVLTREGDGSYLLRMKTGIVQDFGTDGRILTGSDPNGNTLSFAYSSGKLQSVSNTAARSVTLSYDGDRIASVNDGTGRSVLFGYDGAGNLVSCTDARGFITSYAYDLPGRMTQIFPASHPATPLVTNTYDALGKVSTQANANGDTYSYFLSGQRAEEVDPASASHVMYFDRRGKTVIDVSAVATETSFTYDGHQRLTRITHPEGNSIVYQYDRAHNLTGVTVNPKPPSSSPALVKSYTFEPTFNRLRTSTDELNRLTEYFYDSRGNLIRVEQPEVGGVHPTFTYTYNARGQVITQTSPLGTVTRHAYDAATGDRLQVIDDDSGFHYATSMTYDARGNVILRTDALGSSQFQHDSGRLLTRAIAPAPFHFTTDYFYDEDGNLERVERQTDNLLAPQITQYSYTPTFKISSYTDPQLNSTTYEYDSVDRLVSVVDPELHVTSYFHDPAGRLTRIVDARGLDRERYTYTVNGRRSTLQDTNNNITRFVYDEFDRLKDVRYPNNSFQQFTYDPTSTVKTKRTRSGTVISYTYDSLNRPIQEVSPDTGTVQYAYDLHNRLTTLVDGTGTTHFDYDALDRQTRVTYPDGKSVQSGYDALSNRTSITYPDGFVVTRHYDSLERLVEVREGGVTVLAHYDYDALSRRVLATLGNGTTTSFTYEIDGDPIVIDHQFNGGGLTLGYAYDRVHNRISFTDGQRTEGYAYDPTFQLTQFTSTSGGPASIAYALDGTGNRLGVTEDSETTPYVPNNLNQYATVGTSTYGYDTQGNLTTNGVASYTYNTDNRLISATTPELTATYAYDAFGRRVSKTVTPVPPSTRPTHRTESQPLIAPAPVPVTTRYVHDGNQILEQYDGTGSLQVRFIYGSRIDDPILMITSAGSYYYHTDALGSVVALSDESGQLLERYTYDPYGSLQSPSSIPNPYFFTGRSLDEETGLYYYRARYYDPQIGRFLQPDRAGYLDGLNLYTYVQNNPARYVDPSGNIFETIWDIANIGMGIYSLQDNIRSGSWGWAALDAVGLVYDGVATAIPFLPGGASAGLKALRAGNTVVDSVNVGSDVIKIANATDRVAAGMDAAATSLEAARRGTQLHREVAEAMSRNLSELDNFARGANRATGRQPDFPGNGIWVDITTPGQWQRHLDRYGATHGEGISIFYELGNGVLMSRLYSGAGLGLTGLQGLLGWK